MHRRSIARPGKGPGRERPGRQKEARMSSIRGYPRRGGVPLAGRLAVIALAAAAAGLGPRLCRAAGGALDRSFGSGGTVTTDFGGVDEARALVVQADGEIVLAGRSQT